VRKLFRLWYSKKSENKKVSLEEEPNHPKRKSGGQPGHQGKTRKGFGFFITCYAKNVYKLAHIPYWA
jgi:hypothetical protein